MDSAKKSGGVKRKHRALSIAEKVEVLKKLDSSVSVRTICETYSIGSSTVYDIKKQKEKLLKFFSDNMVKSPERNACTGSDEDESSEENEEDVRDRISIDRLITLTTELLAGLEQRSFVSEQEIMNVFLLQDKLIRERPKYMKQQTLPDIFKKIARKQEEATVVSTLDNPLPSTSRQVEAVPVAEDVVTVSDKDDNPDSPSAV
ncbi:Jerky protein-like 10 [Homarus americanus]|uniref:Jerky protein-like 10 n=1 Tax=Homarus americanus TaxID=6706 RepID=A0A8J5MMQ9_HOMAM|nr:Jerky protein-like 10 [Homarus americanus]